MMRRRRSIARCSCKNPERCANRRLARAVCKSNPLDSEDWLRMGVALVLGLGLGYAFWSGSPASVEAANTGTGT